MRLQPLTILAACLISAPAFAVTVNLTDFTYPPPVVVVNGGPNGPSYTGQGGQYYGTLSDDAAAAAGASALSANATAVGSSTSFNAYCVELTQTFNFDVSYEYTLTSGQDYFKDGRSDALSRLFTAAQGFVTDAFSSAAMQAAIWEIVYEQTAFTTGGGFDLTGGSFVGGLQDPKGAMAIATVNGFLLNLYSYGANAQIQILENGNHQDFVIGPVPEPETWALMMGGLGVVGWMARRRRTTAAQPRARATA